MNIEDSCITPRGSTVPNQPAGAFWAVLNRLLIIFQTIILLLAEVEWPMFFFDRFIPVLGSEFGLGALGIFQALCVSQICIHMHYLTSNYLGLGPPYCRTTLTSSALYLPSFSSLWDALTCSLALFTVILPRESVRSPHGESPRASCPLTTASFQALHHSFLVRTMTRKDPRVTSLE